MRYIIKIHILTRYFCMIIRISIKCIDENNNRTWKNPLGMSFRNRNQEALLSWDINSCVLFYFSYYNLVISSSSLWLSRCNFIPMACTNIWSMWWTFKSITISNKVYKIFIIKCSWTSCKISNLLSSFNWCTWYASYSCSNRFNWLWKVCILKNVYVIFILEAVTFLGNQERDRNLYAIPGLDYVAHEDVIPYTVI